MGWVKMKLGDVLKNREGRFKPNDPTIANLKRIDKINFSGQIFLSDKSSNTDMILIKKGDLVISGINVEKGALTVYEGEEDILATIHYSSYIFDTSKIDIDFLKVFLRSPDFVQLLKEQVPGGIKTEIKPKHILPLEVYFPETTKEQKIIAEHFFEKEAKFNQLDEHISYQLTQLENLNQAILQEAVQGKLVKQDPKDEPASELLKRIKSEKATRRQAQGKGKKEKTLPPIKPEEIPFEIPVNWTWCRLGEIIFDTEGGKSPHCLNQNVKGDEWGVIKTTAVQQMEFLEDENKILPKGFKVSDNHKVCVDDVLITRAGPQNRVGVVCCVNQLSKNLILSDKTIRFRHPKNLIYSKYLATVYNAPRMKSIISSKMVGMAESQVNISQDSMKSFLFPLPPLSEQKRIVAAIEKQFALTQQLKEKVIANQQATEQLLKALLHQAFEVTEMEEVNG